METATILVSAAQAKGKITETELQILPIDQELRSEVSKELREIQAKTAELWNAGSRPTISHPRRYSRSAGRSCAPACSYTVGGVITASEMPCSSSRGDEPLWR